MNKKMKYGLLGLCVLGVAATSGTMAYLTDYDAARNEFTVGKVDIDLTEPSWIPSDNEKILPSQVINKDPKITNMGNNDAYVYLEVSIPVAAVTTADKNGNRVAAKDTELFTFEKNSGWTLMEQKLKDGKKVYTYSYDQILTPGSSTPTLFDTVTFVNIIEGQLEENSFEIPVRAYAIQTENTTSPTDADIPAKALTAFQKYITQNNGYEGAVM